MRQVSTVTIATMFFVALGAAAQAAPPESADFKLRDSGDTAKSAHGAKASKIEATKTHAAMKLFVIDKEKGPIKGVVIALTDPMGGKYYTEETDSEGYAEVLVPVGQKYEISYLALGRKGDVAASVTVSNDPKQNVKLTLRYKRQPPPPPFVMTGVNFDTGLAVIRPESFTQLDIVAEFMRLKKTARVEISGHTDNVGNPKANKTLSHKRAHSCRAYLISKGIDGSRIDYAGYGEERPVTTNDTPEGRQKNRRIEVKELQPPA
jgi:OmpA-OmpF porin, OOP family